jgi:hypothetical protein
MFDYRLSDSPDLRSSNYHEQLDVDTGLGWADTANVSRGAGTILESLNGTGIQVEQHIFLTLLMHRLLMCVTKVWPSGSGCRLVVVWSCADEARYF